MIPSNFSMTKKIMKISIKCQEKIDEYTKKQNQSECTTEDQSPNTAFASTTINCAGHMASRQ